jgi:GTPase
MIRFFQQFVDKVLRDIFRKKKKFKLGLYGPPNGGKTTLANRVCADWLGGETMGTTSKVAHETRNVQTKELIIKSKDGKKEIDFTLIDTPGIATKIDYEDFLKEGMGEAEAKSRAKEATQGVIESIQWLDNMDCVVVVLDATLDPFSQVNITIIGNLAARKTPVLIVANKIDLKKANISRIEAAFPQYTVIGISARRGDHMDAFYEALFALAG